jgi:hypothetical protein
MKAIICTLKRDGYHWDKKNEMWVEDVKKI